MSDQPIDSGKRTWIIASSCAGVVGAGFAAAPFIGSFLPSERARAAGAAVEVDISTLKSGEMKTVEWRGKPVWILKRTPAMVDAIKSKKIDGELADPNSQRNKDDLTPAYVRNEFRSIKPEILVAVGICSHLGCSPGTKFQPGPQPSLPDDWEGGFLCPCHGSTFDLAGRVYKNKPAPDNLQVPRHMFVTDNKLVIGKDEKGEA